MQATRDGTFLIALGCAPFAAGAVMPADGDIGLLCPFRAMTGLPCPFCGATRAFAFAARGDAGFTSYNAVWVALAALMILTGLVVLVARRSPVDALTRTTRRSLALIALLTAAGWAYALAERATIAPPS
jgi:hypothetical protein